MWGRSRWEKDPDTKKKRRFLCEEHDWITQKAEHLRIIDEPLWERVRQRQQAVHTASAAIRSALHADARTGRDPKYLFSGLLSCGQCGRRFVMVNSDRYGCSGWRYRGLSVCDNTIMAPRKLVESVLLEAIQHDLFTQEGYAVFQAEVARLWPTANGAGPQTWPRRRCVSREVEQEILNLMTAIKAGIFTVSTKAELEKLEADRTRLQKMVLGQTKADPIETFLPNTIGRFKAMLDNLAHVTQHQVNKTRAILRELMGKEIVLHPTADGVSRYLTAEVSGDYAGLLQLVAGKNKFGGGQAIQPSLAPLLRFGSSIGCSSRLDSLRISR